MTDKKTKNNSSVCNVKSMCWIFVLNNYKDEDVTHIKSIECGSNQKVRALQCQSEIAPTTKTPHLQGFIIFNKQQRVKGVKGILNNNTIHLEPMKATKKANLDYTSKSESYDEEADIFISLGDFETKQGQRNDIRALAKKIDDGASIKDIAKEDPVSFIKYHAGITKYASLVQKIDKDYLDEMKAIQYREWQQKLHDKISEKANSRKIIWVYEKKGNTGKSTFCNKYSAECESDCYYINEIGKIGDAYDGLRNWMQTGKKPRVILIDLARTKEENISIYTFIENVKNGYITCTKYQGETKRFLTPHIVIFSNWAPAITIKVGDEFKDSLSRDRWDIYTIVGDKLISKKLTNLNDDTILSHFD